MCKVGKVINQETAGESMIKAEWPQTLWQGRCMDIKWVTLGWRVMEHILVSVRSVQVTKVIAGWASHQVTLVYSLYGAHYFNVQYTVGCRMWTYICELWRRKNALHQLDLRLLRWRTQCAVAIRKTSYEPPQPLSILLLLMYHSPSHPFTKP